MDILYRFVIPIAIVVLFVVFITVFSSTLTQSAVFGIAGWQVGAWASDIGRWLKHKNSL